MDEPQASGSRTRGAASALAGIRKTFQANLVPCSAYEARIGVMPGDDDAGKPHLAAAEAGRATHIITRDRAGGFPEDCARVVQQMVERRRRRDPDVTFELLVSRWRDGLGLEGFCARMGSS